MSLLEVLDLKVHFPAARGGFFKHERRVIHAVDGVSFKIEEGETLGLVGESGCGKTTTGRCILRLIDATDGEIRFEGSDIGLLKGPLLKGFRKKCQIVFQNPHSSLDPRMTVGSILSEPLKALTSMSKAERDDRIAELLQNVNLDPQFVNRYPHEFSGGQRQRINIARALAVFPKLIVADEPVSALDVSIQAQIINLLQDLQQKFKIAYLFVAHDLSVVRTLSHRVAVMYMGKVVELAPTKTLFETPMHPYTRALMSATPIPDPIKERQRKRIVISSEIPSPVNLPSGCSFHPRCPHSKERCALEAPKMRPVASGSQVACHFAEEI